MKQERFPREYFICRQCGNCWTRINEHVEQPLDVACPFCGINIRNNARDSKDQLIFGSDKKPLPAIEYVEGAERYKAWHRQYLARYKAFYGQAKVGSEVRLQAWCFDILKPYVSYAEFFLYLTLCRFCNEAGIATIGQEQLGFRMSCRLDKDRIRKGSRRATSEMVQRLAGIWIYWDQAVDGTEVEHFRPLVAIERRGRSCSYHVLKELPPGAHKIKVGSLPRGIQEALKSLRGEESKPEV